MVCVWQHLFARVHGCVFRCVSSYVAFVHNNQQYLFTHLPRVALLTCSKLRVHLLCVTVSVWLTCVCVFSLLGAQWRYPLNHHWTSSSFSSSFHYHSIITAVHHPCNHETSLHPSTCIHSDNICSYGGSCLII